MFVFSFYRMAFLVKVSDLLGKLHQICWFSGCDLHLSEAPGLRKPLAILQGQKESSEIYVFWKVFVDFLKSLYFLWLFIVPTGFPLQRKWFSWKKSTRFAGFLAIIFTSQWKNLQKFMHSEKNLEISWKICICFVCQSYYRTRRLGVVRGSDFLEKIHQICWFSGCDFHLPNKKSSADFAFWKKSWEFLKIL